MSIVIIAVTDEDGKIIEPSWLQKAETVHRQLRTALPQNYAAKMVNVFAGGGRMLVAIDGNTVRGVAVYRVYEDTFHGVQLYVDDLVTDENGRSRGVGSTLLAALERVARAKACEWFTLDSGTQRERAHKFYFREGMSISSFHFVKRLMK